MPVEKLEVGEAPAEIRYNQPEGPFVVGETSIDAVGKSTGLYERNPGDEVVTTDIHDQTPSGQFEQPGPEVVELEGFGRPKPQAKVVTPPVDSDKAKPDVTTGAETK